MLSSARTKSWLIGIIISLLGPSVCAEAWFEFQQALEVQGPVNLDLTLTAGDVNITKGSGNRIVIEGIKRVWGRDYNEARQIADLIQVDIRHGGNDVVIATNYLPLNESDRAFPENKDNTGFSHYGKVDYRITAPAFASVSIHASAATIELSSVDGDVTVENGYGKISIESVFGSVRVRQASGDIYLTSIEGDVDVQSSSGFTRGEFLIGPVVLSQDEGEVELKWIEGDIRLKSLSSSVTIGQIQGAIDLENKDGDVSIKTELNSPRNYFVRTYTGAIRFSVPERAAGELQVETKSGIISTEFPIAVEAMTTNRLTGKFGRGGTRIELKSNSGNVTLAAF